MARVPQDKVSAVDKALRRVLGVLAIHLSSSCPQLRQVRTGSYNFIFHICMALVATWDAVTS